MGGGFEGHFAGVRFALAGVVDSAALPDIVAIEFKIIQDDRADEFTTAEGGVGILVVFGRPARTPGDLAEEGPSGYKSESGCLFSAIAIRPQWPMG